MIICKLKLETRNTWTLQELCDVSHYIMIRCVIWLYCMSLQSLWLQFAAMFVLVRDLVIKA